MHAFVWQSILDPFALRYKTKGDFRNQIRSIVAPRIAALLAMVLELDI